MDNLLKKLAQVVEVGKIDKNTPFPPELKGEDGASELTLKAIEQKIDPQLILNNGLMPGMKKIGERFAKGEVFIPNMLIAARAMNEAMEHLRPHFLAGNIKPKGTLVLGTVQGDLHDIGKNLVKMIMKGDGWDVVDLGTDVSSAKFVQAVEENPNCIIGLSALLTTTMLNMEEVVKAVKEKNAKTKVFIGGAPVSQNFANKIGADSFFPDPHSLAVYFN
ncbi:MAG: cobalamin-binding protein [Calditrichaeota bacterium]|nr:MAG: cobalamin-binding protein [Calditrichota bacterium]MBL1206648.1 cobalamin-binding protein [Calditrichota bacterium]NOG46475.1 corrinoid protein [Calditrichota bacterium]